MSLLNKLFTVKEVAELLSLSDSRVRHICIEENIGQKVGRDRFLSKDDIETIRAKQRPSGRPRKNTAL